MKRLNAEHANGGLCSWNGEGGANPAYYILVDTYQQKQPRKQDTELAGVLSYILYPGDLGEDWKE